MPAPSLAALDNILEILRQASCTPFRRDLTITYIRITKYLDRLIPIFEASEDLESTDDLYKLCRIAKYMVLLADDDFFTHIIGDDIIIPFSGMFEHDPDFPNSHPQYRQYLSDPSRFKEVIPINDEAITQKIHYVFRLQYLKDVVLARMLDDNVTQLLNSKIFVYNLDIVTAIESNVDFLGQLVALISDPDAEELRKHNVVLFLHQYCTIAKSLQALVRSNVYRKLAQNGLFTVLEYALTCTLDRVRLAGCELIMTIAEFDKLLLRSYILAQSKQSVRPLIDILVNQFTTDKAPGVQMQCYEILRILLDVQVPAGSDAMQSALIEGRGGNGNDQAP
ncbi:Platinum sensitivity protein, partial [Dimargaris verticillata]